MKVSDKGINIQKNHKKYNSHFAIY